MKFCIIIPFLAIFSIASCKKETSSQNTKSPESTTLQEITAKEQSKAQSKEKNLTPEVYSTRKVTNHKTVVPGVSYEIVTETRTEITPPVMTTEVITKPSKPASQAMADVIKANQNNKDIPEMVLPEEE